MLQATVEANRDATRAGRMLQIIGSSGTRSLTVHILCLFTDETISAAYTLDPEGIQAQTQPRIIA